MTHTVPVKHFQMAPFQTTTGVSENGFLLLDDHKYDNKYLSYLLSNQWCLKIQNLFSDAPIIWQQAQQQVLYFLPYLF